MKRTWSILLKTACIFALTAILSQTAGAQSAKGVISGTIKDSTGRPVEYATISLANTEYVTASNESGQFHLKVAPGAYTVYISGIGFQTVTREVNVVQSQKTELSVRLPFRTMVLKEVNITAGGINQNIKDVPGTVSIIDARQIKESGAQSVGQIISRVPGANYLDEDGRGLKPNIGLRGLDPMRNRNLLVLVDGKFPIGMSFYGDPAAYYMIPIEQAERIEVIKGASPVLYGGGAVGGVINIVTRKAPYKQETSVKAAYGSFNTKTLQVSTGNDNGKYNYSFSALRRQGDGFRDRSAFAINDYTLRFGGRPDTTSEYSFYLNAFSENSQTPGGLTQAQFEQDLTQSRHPNDAFDAKRFSTAFSYKKSFSKYQSLSVSAYGNYFERNWWIGYQVNPDSSTTSGYLRDIHSLGTLVDYNLTRNLLKKPNSLIAGVRVHTDRLDDINARGKSISARSGVTFGNRINGSFIYEFFLYDEFSIDKKLTFAPGVRYTSVSYKRNDLVADRRDQVDVSATVYSAGLIYKPKTHSRLFLTFSKGFQPPSLNSSLDPGTVNAGVDLKPEFSNNLEFGVRSDLVKWLTFSATAYMLDFRNKVIRENGAFRNIGRSLHRGVEAEVEAGSWKGFSLFANGTMQRATQNHELGTSFTDELIGVLRGREGEPQSAKILPMAPQHMLSSGLRYKTRFHGDLVFNVFYQFVGKQYSDTANTETASADGRSGAIPSYKVVNATVNYGRKKWEVFVNINNLLDEKYYTMRLGASPGSGWYGLVPSPGRNFMAGINLKF